MLWHDVVKFVNLLLQPPKGLLCQLDMYFFPSHLYKKILSIQTNIYFYFSSLDWEVKNMFSKHVSVMEKESFLWKTTVIPTEYFRIMDRILDHGTGTDLLIQVINWLIKTRNSSKSSNTCVLFWTANTAIFCFRFLVNTYVVMPRKTEGPRAYARYMGSSAWAEWPTFLPSWFQNLLTYTSNEII